MRQIVLDTETTGIDPNSGHRIIEIGGVEMINRKPTGNHFHEYINPQRDVPEEAVQVHGITAEFLADKPLFADIAEAFFNYIEGAELVIHNAPFDMGFLNHEYRLLKSPRAPLEQHCRVLDTLYLARQKHPGQKNNLDILCKRYGIDNSHRALHGALLDAEILADVYLLMTGGQTSLSLAESAASSKQQVVGGQDAADRDLSAARLEVIRATETELAAHQDFLQRVMGRDNQQGW
ncbi:DNA polymerase III subunit epsilon [Natronospirillum operosum]|uniref:DNA polymerase III subunit epsilon n=1 Tax=Natronospirillum operosum TaxID=2759953 RepID=A0A4Z0WJA9_9GAMM|nr:DNA polymerase III subunit epsilon [Natronospirillum operosum]TGG95897.1 DNA polymerase III subunit epsilon [Natronospirillum operosum]